MLTQTTSILQQAGYIVSNILIPLAFTLALLYFFYGVAKYIWSEGQGKDDGKKIMIWGVSLSLLCHQYGELFILLGMK